MNRKLLLIGILMLSSRYTFPQEAPKRVTPPPDVTQSELESVLIDVATLQDNRALINIRTRAAALVSFSDPARSETMFREIWKSLKEASDKDFDKQRVQAFILRHLFARNPQLAKQLLKDSQARSGESVVERATGQSPNRLNAARLALDLIDTNPRASSELLEQSLPSGMTVAGLNALTRLREQNALLSDSVAAKALAGLRTQPDTVSLSGLHLISAYLFPEGPPPEASSSLLALRIEFFATTYDALRASLSQLEANLRREFGYTDADLRFRAMYQARVAITLAALAPRFRPDLTVELEGIANRLGGVLPSQLAELAKLSAERLRGNQGAPDRPELSIPLELSKGDFEAAAKLIDSLKDEKTKNQYLQLLAKLEAKALLTKGDLIGALTRIRKVEDEDARLILYLDAAKIAGKKRDTVVLGLVVNEARTLIPQVNRNGLHARALLILATQLASTGLGEEALEFLGQAVAVINKLPEPSEESAKDSPAEAAWRELNDARSLLDAPELDNAFSALAASDLDRTLIEARNIQIKPVQLVARLEVIGSRIRADASKRPTTPTSKDVTRTRP